MKTACYVATASLIAALGLAGISPALGQENPPPNQAREQIENLEQKARELKAAGQHEQAQQAMAEAKALREETKPRGDQPGSGQPSPQGERRRAELEKQHRKLAAELEKLRSGGRERKQEEVKERLAKVEEEMARNSNGTRPGGSPPPGHPLGERQRQHLKLAIENLHGAGMHELADHLARELELGRLPGGPRPGPGPRAFASPEPGAGPQPNMPHGELQQLHAEMNELRQALQQMRGRLEEIGHGRP
jgi:hypothetical protein